MSNLISRLTRRTRQASLALVLATTVSTPYAIAGQTKGLHDLDAIALAATEFARDELGTLGEGDVRMATRLDPRLRLAQCDAPLETFLPRGSTQVGRVSVGVRCAGPKPWSVYVQVDVSAPVQVAVTTRFVPRGARLSANDFRFETRDLARVRNGFMDDPARIIGKATRRALRPGSVLSPQLLTAPKLVKRGTRVVIVARANGFEIRAAGQALMDGSEGDVIQVRNLKTKRRVDAVVDKRGIVVVTL